MKRLIFIIIIIFVLSSCKRSALLEDQQKKEIIMDTGTAQNTVKEDNNILKVSIVDLIDEDNYFLEVSCLGSDFYPATNYFASRIISLLSRDLKPEWKDKTINNHQVELKFEGYKTIYINTDLETYWFEGSEEIYSAKGIKQLWARNIVNIIDNKPTYTGVEKSIFTEINSYVDDDANIDKVILFYDGDIRLRINEEEIVIKELVFTLDNYGCENYYSNNPQASANLEFIESLGLLMYTYKGYNEYGRHINDIRFYKYVDNKIILIWSSSNLTYQIDASNIIDGKVDLIFPFFDKHINVNLDKDEVDYNEYFNLEHDGYDYNTFSKTDIPIDNGFNLDFKDYDGDGNKELILLGCINTNIFGSSDPLGIDDEIVFVFKLLSDRLECVDIEIKRNEGSGRSPFEYFT